MKGPSSCEPFDEPSAVSLCEEEGSAEGSPEGSTENQGSPEGSTEPSYEPEVSYEPAHEGDGQVNHQMKPLKRATTQSVLPIGCNPNKKCG